MHPLCLSICTPYICTPPPSPCPCSLNTPTPYLYTLSIFNLSIIYIYTTPYPYTPYLYIHTLSIHTLSICTHPIYIPPIYPPCIYPPSIYTLSIHTLSIFTHPIYTHQHSRRARPAALPTETKHKPKLLRRKAPRPDPNPRGGQVPETDRAQYRQQQVYRPLLAHLCPAQYAGRDVCEWVRAVRPLPFSRCHLQVPESV